MQKEVLKKLRLLVLDDKEDQSRDEIIEEVYKLVEDFILYELNKASQLYKVEGFINVPEELEFILRELFIIRFNMLGSEGLASESISSHSYNFDKTYKDEYRALINDYVRRRDIRGLSGGRLVIY